MGEAEGQAVCLWVGRGAAALGRGLPPTTTRTTCSACLPGTSVVRIHVIRWHLGACVMGSAWFSAHVSTGPGGKTEGGVEGWGLGEDGRH